MSDANSKTSKSAILAIDTAMNGCGVAVYDPARGVIATDYSDDPRGQAQILIPLVQDVLEEASCGFDDLAAILVCNGPGTFTGIRIGLSAAKTFGLTLDIPVYAFTSLYGLALSAVKAGIKDDMLALVETRRQDFYVQGFDSVGKSIGEPQSLMENEIEVQGCVLIGDAVARFDKAGEYTHFDMARIDVATIARRFHDYPKELSADSTPIYLRAPDVSQPKNKPRILSDK